MHGPGDRAGGGGAPPGASKRTPAMPVTDNEIKEKYLERAIRELNQLSRDLQSCEACLATRVMPVLGSGHPQADIMLVKFAPTTAEVEEGVAFYGRAGNALMKSFKRLSIDPTVIYGTLCAKCPVEDPSQADPECIARLADEFNIVQPRIVVVMGDAALETVNGLGLPLARTLEAREGEIQAFTPACDAIFTPDIDGALDEETAKRRFWRAFRTLGRWHDDLPPY
ncbi:MAG: uracil-DNA glycosylase [Solirubrobacterales bacterium]|nr:uracil-DNA glycosylase [Solirubrobacterales bacterium]